MVSQLHGIDGVIDVVKIGKGLEDLLVFGEDIFFLQKIGIEAKLKEFFKVIYVLLDMLFEAFQFEGSIF